MSSGVEARTLKTVGTNIFRKTSARSSESVTVRDISRKMITIPLSHKMSPISLSGLVCEVLTIVMQHVGIQHLPDIVPCWYNRWVLIVPTWNN